MIIKCPKCGQELEIDDEMIGTSCQCPVCSQIIEIPKAKIKSVTPAVQVASSETLPHPAKSKTAYLLLGIFLGGYGIHDFYAGYTEKGLIKLGITILTCGVFGFASWIWAIIDVCTVETDANGNPFVQ